VKKHFLYPEEKEREHQRSSPGLSLIVGGFSRLGGITHSYLINPSSLAVVGAVAAVAAVAVTVIVVAVNWTPVGEMIRLTTAAASIVVVAPFAFFLGQGRWVANVVVVAKAIAVVVARSIVIVVVVVVVTTHCLF
jgi:hypothetical protein